MQTSAAGLSQCIIMDVLNDIMQFGLECFASECLYFLGFELWECEKVWLRSSHLTMPGRVSAFWVLSSRSVKKSG
eukprot:scaffold59470_cov36-Cyclotella_meneghiniana.AAC.1